MGRAVVLLCPGQGAQTVGMGKAWFERSAAARAVFAEADEVFAAISTRLRSEHQPSLPPLPRLSEVCFNGPAEVLNATDVAQAALYVTGVASWRAMLAGEGWNPEWAADSGVDVVAAAGLSLGEYTALHIAGAFGFADGLRLVAMRGRFMQDAATATASSMVALMGAEEDAAQRVCDKAREGNEVLVTANFNAPGQIVLSGSKAACQRAIKVAGEEGLRAQELTVAGAFHSAIMQPGADRMAAALETVSFQPLRCPVIANVTARPHELNRPEEVKRLLVQQITSPVRWSQSCTYLGDTIGHEVEYHELAPGKVLSGLMRRINREVKVTNHDQPEN